MNQSRFFWTDHPTSVDSRGLHLLSSTVFCLLVVGSIGGCGTDTARDSAGEDEVLLDTSADDTEDASDLAHEADGVDDADVGDVDEIGEGCVADETTCRQGVIATCRADGTGWSYSACPVGEVCVTDRCVTNLPSVTIVTNTSMPDENGTMMGGWPSELVNTITETMCDEVPQCCDVYLTAWEVGGTAASAIATKYWVRRLLIDLDSLGEFHYALLGPPTVTDATAIPAPNHCGPTFETQLEACLGGSERLLRVPELDRILSGLYPSSVQPTSLQIPAWTDRGETTDEFDVLMAAITKETSIEIGTLLRWVDGVSGGPSKEPELNVTPAAPYPMNWLAYLHLAKGARPEGRPCTDTTACGHPHYTCIDGFCSDPAAACRVHEQVFVDTFASPAYPPWVPEECTGGLSNGADHNVWTQWLRWGLGCDKGWICREGSTCLDTRDVSSAGNRPSVDLCFPDELREHITDPLVDRLLWNYLYAVPDRYAVDAARRRMRVTSHAILVNTSIADYGYHGLEPLEDATIAAAAGGGVAVTPCAPAVLESGLPLRSSLVECDDASRYAALIEGIAARARSSTCTPADVGLVE